MSTSPSISVVIPCYNAVETVRMSIESVWAQTLPPIEIVCVDDGSTDGSLDVLSDLKADSPIPFTILKGPNGGASHARNRGTRVARGEYLQYLDADDVLAPTKLEHQAELLAGRPAFVAGAYWSLQPDPRLPRRLRAVEPDVWLGLVTARLGITSANLWRRDAVIEVGLWDENRRTSEDPELVFRLMKAGGQVVIDNEPLTYKNELPDSLWRRDGDASLRGWWRLRIEIARYVAKSDEFEANRRQAIGTYLLSRIRGAYRLDPALARDINRVVRALRPKVREAGLGRAYGTLYMVTGLVGAEWVARTTRRLRVSVRAGFRRGRQSEG